jgi:hypothetical protein
MSREALCDQRRPTLVVGIGSRRDADRSAGIVLRSSSAAESNQLGCEMRASRPSISRPHIRARTPLGYALAMPRICNSTRGMFGGRGTLPLNGEVLYNIKTIRRNPGHVVVSRSEATRTAITPRHRAPRIRVAMNCEGDENVVYPNGPQVTPHPSATADSRSPGSRSSLTP